MDSIISWLKINWRLSYLIYSALVCVLLVLLMKKLDSGKKGAQLLAKIWGSIGFALLLFYMVGAAENRIQFLTMFGFGALGSALGYLAGIALSPSNLSEESRFSKFQSMLATLLAGAFGTKLLSLWDDLTKGDQKLIYQPAFYLPLLCALVGFFIALAAFYTLRAFAVGNVKITAPTAQFVQWVDANQKTHQNGVAAATAVQFSASADFDDDVSVSWAIRPQNNQANAVALPNGTLSASGLLTAPNADWIRDHAGALDWRVIATSNRDQSRCAACDVHFV